METNIIGKIEDRYVPELSLINRFRVLFSKTHYIDYLDILTGKLVFIEYKLLDGVRYITKLETK